MSRNAAAEESRATGEFRGIPDHAHRKSDRVPMFYAKGIQPPRVQAELIRRRARIAQARAEEQERQRRAAEATPEQADADAS